MDDYNIENGIFGMGKIVSGRLSQYLNEKKRRQFYGTGQEQYENKSKENVFYKSLFPNLKVLYGKQSDIKKIEPNIISGELKKHTLCIISQPMSHFTGRYILKLKILNPNIMIYIVDDQFIRAITFLKETNCIDFNRNEPLEWNGDDNVIFEVDTDKNVIKYTVNNNTIYINNKIKKPVYFMFRLFKDQELQIDSFQYKR
jgi:hypothetical protein